MEKVLVIGSGPITAGQAVELDYAGIHAILALKEENVQTVVLNSNAASVMTDRAFADTVYIEPVTLHNILRIVEIERPQGIIASPAGILGFTLMQELKNRGDLDKLGVVFLDEPTVMKHYGNKASTLHSLSRLQIPVPKSATATTQNEAIEAANNLGYPVFVRPTLLKDSQGAQVIYDESELLAFISTNMTLSPTHPLLIDQFIVGKEVELDGVSDGTDVFIGGIVEHIEGTGVHSCDSIAVYPTQTINPRIVQTIADYGIRIAREFKIKGVFNIQFALDAYDHIYVLDINMSASRTMPVLSKVQPVNLFRVATKAKIGISLRQQGLKTGLQKRKEDLVTVKAPVFSFASQRNLEIFLGPQVKSTGEVIGTAKTYGAALKKAFIACGIGIPHRAVLFSTGPNDFPGVYDCAIQMFKLGLKIYATPRTGAYLESRGMDITVISHDNIFEFLSGRAVDLILNTPTKGEEFAKRGLLLRKYALELSLPIVTSLDTLTALIFAMCDETPHEDVMTL